MVQCAVQGADCRFDELGTSRMDAVALTQHWEGGNLRHFSFHVVGYVMSRMYVCHARRYEVETRIHKGFHHANRSRTREPSFHPMPSSSKQ